MKNIKINNYRTIRLPDCLRLIFSLIIYLLAATSNLYAVEWKQNSGIGATINYIDNVTLSRSGFEQSDVVYEVKPFITVEGLSGRSEMELFYQLQAVNYTKFDGANSVYHQLYADANLELSEELLFLDIQVTNSQNIITTKSNLPIGNLPISNNRTNVATYLVSPYISKNFSTGINLLMRGRFSKAYYDNTLVNNIGSEVENRAYTFSLGNNSGSGYIGWKFNFNRTEFSTNIIGKNIYEIKSLRLAYGKNQQFIPFIVGGVEDNGIYQSSLNSGGGYWNAGVEWKPTPRTSISASKGARFYGDSSQFSWATRGRWMQVGVNYNESVTTSSTLFSRQTLGQVRSFGNSYDYVDITDSVFVSKRFTSRLSYTKSKTTISWRIYSDDRKFISTGKVQKYKGINVSWGWRFGTRTSMLLGANWVNSKRETQGENTIQTLSLVASRIVSNKLKASLGYRHRNNKIESGTSTGYKQNVIFLNATASFK